MDDIRITAKGTLGTGITGEALTAEVDFADKPRAMAAHIKCVTGGLTANAAFVRRAVPKHVSIKKQLESLLHAGFIPLDNAMRELNEFKIVERQTRLFHGLPVSPPKVNKLAEGIGLGLACVTESGLNSVLMMSSSMLATPGEALLNSVLISVANLGWHSFWGYRAGAFLEYGLHSAKPQSPENKKARTRAKVGVGICAVGGAGLMLTMGLMRAQEEFVVSHSLADYIDMLCNTHAVVMMLAGTVVACMSYYTGKRMNVHGLEITQRVDRGEAELEAIEEELRDKVDELVDEAAEETKAAIAEADAEVSRHNKLIEQSRYQLSDLELEIDRAEGNFEIELTNLTETNELVRRRGRPRNNTALTRVAPFHKYLSGLLIPTPLERADHTHALQYLEEVRAEAHEQITTRIKTTLIDFDGE